MKIKILLIQLSIAFLLLANYSYGQTEISNAYPGFVITVKVVGNAIQLECLENCAWKQLNYNYIQGKSQVIDEYGMTQKNNVSARKDPNLDDFLLSIEKVDDQIKLTGLEGTTWETMSFTFKPNVAQGFTSKGIAMKKE